MRAISLWQPWATLVAIGAKKVETRPRALWLPGWIAIHATKAFPGGAGQWSTAMTQPFRNVLLDAGYRLGLDHNLPLGAIVAIARHESCIPTGAFTAAYPQLATEQELAFGNYAPGRYAYILPEVIALPEPIPARGKQGIWYWDAPDHVLALLP